MPSQGNALAGEYSIPKSLKKELQKEFERDMSISAEEIHNEMNQNDYNRQRFQTRVDLNFEDEGGKAVEVGEKAVEVGEKAVEVGGKAVEVGEKGREKSEAGDKQATQEGYGYGKRRLDLDETSNFKKRRDEISNLPKDLTLIQKLKDGNVPVINGVPLTDEVLTKILPSGFTKIIPAPAGFENNQTRPELSLAAPEYYLPPMGDYASANVSLSASAAAAATEIPGLKGLEYFKDEDMKYFGNLLKIKPEDLTEEEQKEMQSMKLVLKAKNGTQIVRKRAMRALTENAVKFGPKILLSQILPVLLEPTLGEQERHLLVKMVGRIMLRLNESIRPYTSKIIHVLSPFLIDEESTIRMETREIITSLTKAVGFANMISTLRPDLDHVDEYVRNLTSRVLAIVANTLGLNQFLPFLQAVVKSKRTWTARHTGIKVVQQLCLLLGSGNGSSLLPFLSQIVRIILPAINDEMQQVKTITVLTLAQLAESVAPYGIDSFEQALEPLWYEIRRQRGRGLAAFLKCVGSLIPLMKFDARYEEYTYYYTKEVMFLITKQFGSPDEDMRKTMLKVLTRLPLSKELIPDYESSLVKPFFKSFWNRRTASDNSQITKLVVGATNHLASKFDFLSILNNVVYFAKDDNEQLRRLAIEAINLLVSTNPDELVGMTEDEVRVLVDGILFAFQEQAIQNKIYLQTFASISKALGIRLKPHLSLIISSALYRIKNKTPEIRQQSSDLIAIIAPVIRKCTGGEHENNVVGDDDNSLLEKLVLILYEALGEVYPEVLGSIINALYSCINSLSKTKLLTMNNPSVNQILPTLTPILKNRHEKVQESSIKLIGLIATKNAETINAKEWMRICFDLLEMLKSTRKRIRIAANATFGYIAKTIGPQDVIVMLLNNLKVQERQLRVCTAVAMGIVVEICQPFTVLPAIMNEYRTPEKNVQNGVLKALSFLFEYLDGKTTMDYLFAITPLLEDALIDRDLVHRQTAATVVFHIAMNLYGLIDSDYSDVFIHFLNLIMPNIYETSPHVISRILESLDSLRLVLGNGIFMNYIWAGLFHPARKVRDPFWKVFNSAYVQSADSLVPYYPRIGLMEKDTQFKLEELDLCL
ncbi:prp10 [Candida oxycetoniae]|uniref:Prp10 n=1 Tax=Candida oxycetoniae TaxID=497107 RepID=A0AAI9T152_9ASCO|nr:prp10 [Candida oxycetoniae]KAI3406702.2 prp10 [Candida oxycetoniae]